MSVVRKTPCPECPFRKDVPSGLWAPEEYDKLPAYDRPTAEQPVAAFSCHATPVKLCHGWACRSMPPGHDLLALRIHGRGEVPPPAVPLFDTALEAAEHGLADVDDPTPEAQERIERLRRYPRLR